MKVYSPIVLGCTTLQRTKWFVAGRGIVGVENEDNWHGKPLGDKAEAAIAALEAEIHGNKRSPSTLRPSAPVADAVKIPTDYSKVKLATPPGYTIGEKVATRLAYGTALVKLGQNCDRVVALDCDVKNSTFSDKFRKVHNY